MFLQRNYTEEEVFNLILHGGGFLKILSNLDRKPGVVGEPRYQHKVQGCSLGRL